MESLPDGREMKPIRSESEIFLRMLKKKISSWMFPLSAPHVVSTKLPAPLPVCPAAAVGGSTCTFIGPPGKSAAAVHLCLLSSGIFQHLHSLGMKLTLLWETRFGHVAWSRVSHIVWATWSCNFFSVGQIETLPNLKMNKRGVSV